MIIAESRPGRRIVGRLDRGQNLFEALVAVCRERGVRSGELRALGSVESVELAEYDQVARAWKPARTIAGGLEVAHLGGHIAERDGQLALHLHATLMRDRDSGLELVGGHLVGARVFALEFVIDCFDDLLLRRAVDPATGLSLWSEALELRAPVAAAPPVARSVPVAVPVPAPVPAPTAPEEPEPHMDLPRFEAVVPKAPPPPRTSWTQVAEASAQKPRPDDGDGEPEEGLAPGDVVIHPTFGRCEVQRIEGSYEFAHVRLKNGRLVRLSLDVLKVSLAGSEGSRRLFKARVDG